MNDFQDSEFEGTEMAQDSIGLQLVEVVRRLDKIAQTLNDVQINLSNLAVRHYNVVSNMEKEQQQVKESLQKINKEIDSIYERLEKVEQFMWKFSGALAAALFVSQLVIKYFNL